MLKSTHTPKSEFPIERSSWLALTFSKIRTINKRSLVTISCTNSERLAAISVKKKQRSAYLCKQGEGDQGSFCRFRRCLPERALPSPVGGGGPSLSLFQAASYHNWASRADGMPVSGANLTMPTEDECGAVAGGHDSCTQHPLGCLYDAAAAGSPDSRRCR